MRTTIVLQLLEFYPAVTVCAQCVLSISPRSPSVRCAKRTFNLASRHGTTVACVHDFLGHFSPTDTVRRLRSLFPLTTVNYALEAVVDSIVDGNTYSSDAESEPTLANPAQYRNNTVKSYPKLREHCRSLETKVCSVVFSTFNSFSSDPRCTQGATCGRGAIGSRVFRRHSIHRLLDTVASVEAQLLTHLHSVLNRSCINTPWLCPILASILAHTYKEQILSRNEEILRLSSIHSPLHFCL